MSPSELDALPDYIVANRKSNMKRLVRAAIENELDELEKDVIEEKYFRLLPISEIALLHGVTRAQVYRTLEAACDKLYTSLKYAYFCGFSLLCTPENFEQLIKGERNEYRYSTCKS